MSNSTAKIAWARVLAASPEIVNDPVLMLAALHQFFSPGLGPKLDRYREGVKAVMQGVADAVS